MRFKPGLNDYKLPVAMPPAAPLSHHLPAICRFPTSSRPSER
jgi:hypothetical protein